MIPLYSVAKIDVIAVVAELHCCTISTTTMIAPSCAIFQMLVGVLGWGGPRRAPILLSDNGVYHCTIALKGLEEDMV